MALRFNGTDANYQSRTTDLLSINASYTWMAWIKITVDTNDAAVLYGAGNNALTQIDSLTLGATGTQLVVATNGGGGTGGSDLTVGTWYHVALVRSTSSLLTMYLNGVSDGTDTTSVGTSRTMEMMCSGSALGSAYPFDGCKFAEKAWSRALSVDEILVERSAIRPVQYASLYAWWPGFDSVIANATKDFSGSGRDWTANGTISIEDGTNVPYGGRPLWIPVAPVSISYQYARPSSDVTVGAWTPSTGATLWETVDETASTVGDYMSSLTASGATATWAEMEFGAFDSSPSTHDSHEVRVLARSVTGQTLTVILRNADGTAVATGVFTALSATWTTYSLPLTSAQAEALDDSGFKTFLKTT